MFYNCFIPCFYVYVGESWWSEAEGGCY